MEALVELVPIRGMTFLSVWASKVRLANEHGPNES